MHAEGISLCLALPGAVTLNMPFTHPCLPARDPLAAPAAAASATETPNILRKHSRRSSSPLPVTRSAYGDGFSSVFSTVRAFV